MSADADDQESAPPDGPEPGELYVAVRRGVYDAIWDVLGSLAMAVFSLFLFLVGLAFVSAGFQNEGTGALLAGTFGVVIVLVAVLQFLHEFDVWPFG